MASGTKKNLQKAKNGKNDEFYTLISDIENEMKHYREHFKNKVIFCNCDDPEESDFWKFFQLNFDFLGLKKLIATHYEEEKSSYKLEMTSDGTIKTPLKQNGDFRSDECIEILKKSDIVVTNPPFSLFREYVAQLIKYDKKFIIIGNVNSLTYKEIFPLILNNKIWLGASIHSGDREFKVPKDYEVYSPNKRVDDKGNVYVRVNGVRWFTNLDYPKRHEDIIPYMPYNQEDYPEYVNYDAINVDKTKFIPKDYFGKMGVPITFLDKYNPEQFEIIAMGKTGMIEFKNNRRMEVLDKFGESTGKFTNNGTGILYRKFNPKKDKYPAFKDCETGELYESIYARIIIKRRVN